MWYQTRRRTIRCSCSAREVAKIFSMESRSSKVSCRQRVRSPVTRHRRTISTSPKSSSCCNKIEKQREREKEGEQVMIYILKWISRILSRKCFFTRKRPTFLRDGTLYVYPLLYSECKEASKRESNILRNDKKSESSASPWSQCVFEDMISRNDQLLLLTR